MVESTLSKESVDTNTVSYQAFSIRLDRYSLLVRFRMEALGIPLKVCKLGLRCKLRFFAAGRIVKERGDIKQGRCQSKIDLHNSFNSKE